jgi:arsenite/tail-anchored protein-transporting ATPase
VVDCAPTAETLRLLSLPHALGWYLERVFPLQRKVATVVRPVLGRVTTMPLPQDRFLGAVERLHTTLGAVRALLADGERTSVRLVTNPEKIVIAEAQRTFTHLSLFGYHVDAVIVNRLLPDAVTDPYFAGWKEAQRGHLETVRSAFAGLPVLTAPLFDAEPVGVARLAPLADALYTDCDPAAVLHADAPLRVERVPEGFRLAIALPFVDRRDLDVFRRGDELYVKVGASTRTLVLPAALQRCTVAGAGMRDGRLEVRFRAPDPAAAADAAEPPSRAAGT